MPNDHRHQRLTELLFEEIAALFRDDIRNPRLAAVRITGVELSPDGASARIWYVLTSGATDRRGRRDVERALAGTEGFLRTNLVETLALKRAPDLRFVFDDRRLPDESNQTGRTTDAKNREGLGGTGNAGGA